MFKVRLTIKTKCSTSSTTNIWVQDHNNPKAWAWFHLVWFINQVEIENFILNGEAANLRERVTFKNNRPFAKDRVILSNADYELLEKKARQYELIDYMNKQMTVKAREQA